MKPKKIPRIVKAYLMMLSITLGFVVGGLFVLIPVTLGLAVATCWALWGLFSFVAYGVWYLTATKHREKLVEWGVIES